MYFRLMGKLNARRQNLLEDNEKGFTLIELLVVVIIIGILAAIAIPVYLGVQKNSQDSSTQSDVTNAKIAIVSAQTNSGTLPTSGTSGYDLKANVSSTPSGGNQSYSAAGVTVSQYTSSLKYVSQVSANTFCVVGVSSNGTTYYATDSAGTAKLASGATLPGTCTTGS